MISHKIHIVNKSVAKTVQHARTTWHIIFKRSKNNKFRNTTLWYVEINRLLGRVSVGIVRNYVGSAEDSWKSQKARLGSNKKWKWDTDWLYSARSTSYNKTLNSFSNFYIQPDIICRALWMNKSVGDILCQFSPKYTARSSKSSTKGYIPECVLCNPCVWLDSV